MDDERRSGFFGEGTMVEDGDGGQGLPYTLKGNLIWFALVVGVWAFGWGVFFAVGALVIWLCKC